MRLWIVLGLLGWPCTLSLQGSLVVEEVELRQMDFANS